MTKLLQWPVIARTRWPPCTVDVQSKQRPYGAGKRSIKWTCSSLGQGDRLLVTHFPLNHFRPLQTSLQRGARVAGHTATSGYEKTLQRIERMARGLQNPQLEEDESDGSVAGDVGGEGGDDKAGDDAMEVEGGSGDEAPEVAEPDGNGKNAYDLLDDWIDDSEVRTYTAYACLHDAARTRTDMHMHSSLMLVCGRMSQALRAAVPWRTGGFCVEQAMSVQMRLVLVRAGLYASAPVFECA